MNNDGYEANTHQPLREQQGSSFSDERRMVEDNPGKRDRANRRDTPTMASLAEKSPQDFQHMAEKLEEMGSDFFRYVTGKDIKTTSRYLSDVILVRDDRQLSKCMDVLREYGRCRRNGLFGYVAEGDHIHVIHDCAYSGGHCRDVWRSQVEPYGDLRPARRYNKPIWKFNRVDWYDVFVYFFVQKRGDAEIWIRGESGQVPSDFERVRWTGELEKRGSMVRCGDSSSDDECERQSYKRSRRSTGNTPDNEIYGKKAYSAGKFSYIKSKTKALLLKYYCSPVSAVRDISEFRSDDVLSDPKNKDYIQAAFDDFGRDINEYTLRDIYNVLQNATPLFFTSMNYDTRENSLEIVDELIRFQCQEDDELIAIFLNSVVDIIDKRLSKCNALSIYSPPSAGKNFFVDMILAILLNYGQLGQANKHNVFAFQEAPNKRVLIWNEPNYESCLTDTLKMMMAGDPFTVRVKHAMDTHVKRTPVFILTNNYVPFLCDSAFADRIVQFRWNAAPFLKEYEMKPYPMCFFDLLNKYNIKYYNVFLLYSS